MGDSFLRITIPITNVETHNNEMVEKEDGPIANPNNQKIGGQAGGQVGGQVESLTERQRDILEIIIANPKISRKQLAEELKINESAVQKHIDALKKKNIIERDSATTGQWIIKIQK